MYIAILLVILYSMVFNHEQGRYRTSNLFNLILLLLILCAGLRYMVGSDTISYMLSYNDLPTIKQIFSGDVDYSRFEPLWMVFCALCKTISANYFFMQFVHAIIINTIILFFIKRYTTSKSLYLAIFLYFVGCFLYFNTEILRESLAVCAFLLSIRYLQEKKYIFYFIGCIIAALFHTSAIVCFIAPLFMGVKNNKRGYIILISICVFSSVLWVFFQQNIQHFYFIDSMESKVNAYIGTGLYEFNTRGTILRIIVNFFLPFFMLLLNRKKTENKVNNTLFPFVYIYVILGLFNAYNNVIFDRFQNYFVIPFWIYTANTILSSWKDVRFRIITPALITCLIIVGQYYPYSKYDVTGAYKIYERYFPYTSTITQKETPSRKSMENHHKSLGRY